MPNDGLVNDYWSLSAPCRRHGMRGRSRAVGRRRPRIGANRREWKPAPATVTYPPPYDSVVPTRARRTATLRPAPVFSSHACRSASSRRWNGRAGPAVSSGRPRPRGRGTPRRGAGPTTVAGSNATARRPAADFGSPQGSLDNPPPFDHMKSPDFGVSRDDSRGDPAPGIPVQVTLT